MADNNTTNLPAVLDPLNQDFDDNPLPPLNNRQKAFIHHYMTDAQMNPAKAARLAGYASSYPQLAHVSGYELLRNPSVKAHIEAAIAAAYKPPAVIVSQLEAASDGIGAYLTHNKETGELEVDWDALMQDGRAFIVEGIEYNIKGKQIVKLASAHESRVELAKLHRLFPSASTIHATQVNINPPAERSREEQIADLHEAAAFLGYRVVPQEDTETGATIDSTLKDE